MIEPLDIKKGARLKRRDNFLQCHTHIHTSTHTHTLTHTVRRGFLHVFDTVGSGCTMRDLLTPLHPCNTHQMAQNGGPVGLPCSPELLLLLLLFSFFRKRWDAFQRSTHHRLSRLPNTQHSLTNSPLSLLHDTHPYTLSLSHTHTHTYTHTHTHAEVKPPPCTSSSSTWVWGRKWEGRKRRPGGERGVCFCWVLVPLNIRYR